MASMIREGGILCIAWVATASSAYAQWQPDYSFEVRRAGFFGAEYTSGTGFQSSTPGFPNSVRPPEFGTGFLVGFSERLGPAGENRGRDFWVYDLDTGVTTLVGLLGPEFQTQTGVRSGGARWQTQEGRVIGTAARFHLVTGASNGSRAWYFDPTTMQSTAIGLNDAIHYGSEGYYWSVAEGYDKFGNVVGLVYRVQGLETNVGVDTWAFIRSTGQSVRTGLTELPACNLNGRHKSTNNLQSANGHAAGISLRYKPDGQANGESTWAFDAATGQTAQTGFTGGAYQGSAGYELSTNKFISDSGRVFGDSRRITGVSTSAGQTAWEYNPATGLTSRLGLAGPQYVGSSGYESHQLSYANAAGDVAGRSIPITGVQSSNGIHTWVYNQSTGQTHRTGLTGPAFTGSAGYQQSDNARINANGQVAGSSMRISGVNTTVAAQTWVYEPATQETVPTGLTGPDYVDGNGVNASQVRSQTDSGFVLGVSYRIATGANLGWGVWVYDPSTRLSTQAGLTGAIHTAANGRQENTSTGVSENGVVSGEARRMDAIGNWLGVDTWAYNPATGLTVQIGLVGPEYIRSDGYASGQKAWQNSSGQIVGQTSRSFITNGGSDAWYYDPATNTTYMPTQGLPNMVRAIDGYRGSGANYITEDGIMLGTYTEFIGDDFTGVEKVFVYRPDMGLAVLGDLAEGGLSASGLATLQQTLYFQDLDIIVGRALALGQSATDGSKSVFVAKRILPATCPADLDDGSGSGTPGGGVDINDLLYFLSAFEAGSTGADIDDGSGSGTPSGGVDINDLLYFLTHFEVGC